MEASQHLRQMAWIHQGLMPIFWVIIFFLMLNVAINSMYLYSLFFAKDREIGPEPIDPTEADLDGYSPIQEIPTTVAFPLVPASGIGHSRMPSHLTGHTFYHHFLPCSECFVDLPTSKQFIYSMLKPPNCSSGTLLPCQHKGVRYWQCLLDSSIKCHLLHIPWSAIYLGTRPNPRVPNQMAKRCSSCLQPNGDLWFRLGRPSSCTQLNFPPCLHDGGTYYKCNGTEGVLCYIREPWGSNRLGNHGALLQWKPPRIKRSLIEPDPSHYKQCQHCIHVTKSRNKVMYTLIYHTSTPQTCKQFDLTTCSFNGTTYKRCSGSLGIECYDPKQATKVVEYQITLHHVTYGRKEEITRTTVPALNQRVQLKFDACYYINRNTFPQGGCGGLEWERSYAINHKYVCASGQVDCRPIDHKYCPYWECVTFATWTQGVTGKMQFSLTKGMVDPNCKLGQCNPMILSFTPVQVLKSPIPFGLQIDGKGSDPGMVLSLEISTSTHVIGQKKSFFWSISPGGRQT
ncbi:uncharacterized protein [Erythrolamprus reginae]|uniref:uncharacterized protein n=1 Tax=Erythrolamprus reginae TaxID=121349 RepID=UPI00396C3779